MSAQYGSTDFQNMSGISLRTIGPVSLFFKKSKLKKKLQTERFLELIKSTVFCFTTGLNRLLLPENDLDFLFKVDVFSAALEVDPVLATDFGAVI